MSRKTLLFTLLAVTLAAVALTEKRFARAGGSSRSPP
jgi:hypothetical protein